MNDVAAKLWNFCHTLRHDGVDYGDYIEQLTFLLFLKMADEQEVPLPSDATWPELIDQPDSGLIGAYGDMLDSLGRAPGILGEIYNRAQVRLTSATSLRQLITLIDQTKWSSLGEDVQAAAFEGLLERAASEGKKGAGQYFTPRILIDVIVACLQPMPRGAAADFRLSDPACGTGGFLVAAHDWMQTQADLSRSQLQQLERSGFHGQELVDRPRRLALMNLFLRGINPRITLGDSLYGGWSGEQYDFILTNPPFGTRGTVETPQGPPYEVKTSNKQLNFLQLVAASLKPDGHAAIVLPDNALFADHASEVFANLMSSCDVHTVLRCPRGTFNPYTDGTNTNVVFLDRAGPTTRTSIYDARTNISKITKRSNPLTREHFQEFTELYRQERTHASGGEPASASERWQSFSLDEVAGRHYKLDAFRWIEEDSRLKADDSTDPEELLAQALESLVLASDALSDLQAALESAVRSE